MGWVAAGVQTIVAADGAVGGAGWQAIALGSRIDRLDRELHHVWVFADDEVQVLYDWRVRSGVLALEEEVADVPVWIHLARG